MNPILTSYEFNRPPKGFVEITQMLFQMPKPEFSPEVTDALIEAIPENPYDLCPCGCGQKWRFVLKSPDVKEHADRFCKSLEKKNAC